MSGMGLLKDNNIPSDEVYIISGTAIFYQSGAAYERIFCYAKALAEHGCKIFLCSPLLDEFEVSQLIIKNIYLIGKTNHNKRPLYGYFKTIKYFKFLKSKMSNTKTNKVIITFPPTLALDIILLVWFKFIYGIDVFCEKNELKIGMTLNYAGDKKSWKRIILQIFIPFQMVASLIHDLIMIFYNGVIVISTGIEKISKRLNKKVVRLPILVDTNKFSPNHLCDEGNNILFKIGYFGAISQQKDGIVDFLKAFIALVIPHKKEILIELYGDENFIITSLLTKYPVLQKKIIIKGSIAHEDVVKLMPNYDLLILTRPLNLQTKFGFSTKLAEYMASGVPVLVTDVSDNKLYIKGGTNGFVAKPGNIISIVQKLEEILQMDKQRLKEIGLRGRETAIKYFDYRNYSVTLYNFLFSEN
jgi:glycosyltransferase involved in cell wall biosynthesis